MLYIRLTSGQGRLIAHRMTIAYWVTLHHDMQNYVLLAFHCLQGQQPDASQPSLKGPGK